MKQPIKQPGRLCLPSLNLKNRSGRGQCFARHAFDVNPIDTYLPAGSVPAPLPPPLYGLRLSAPSRRSARVMRSRHSDRVCYSTAPCWASGRRLDTSPTDECWSTPRQGMRTINWPESRCRHSPRIWPLPEGNLQSGQPVSSTAASGGTVRRCRWPPGPGAA